MKHLAGLLVVWTIGVVIASRFLYRERDCNPDDVDGCLAVRASDEWLFNAGAVGVWLFGAALVVGLWTALKRK